MIGIKKLIKSAQGGYYWNKVLAAAVLVFGLLVLSGWIFNIEFFKRLFPGLVAMNPLTAICFVFSALALFRFADDDKKKPLQIFGVALSCFVLAAAIIKLGGVFLDIDTPIDSFLFHNELETDLVGKTSNRMAPNTALGFVFTGFALLFLNRQTKNGNMPAQYLAMPVGILGMLSVLGYLYHVQALYGFLTYIPMAVHTAICFLLMSLAILITHSEKGIMAQFTGQRVGSVAARKMIPAAIIVPVALGFIRLYSVGKGFLPHELGTAILILGIILIFLTLIWFNARELNLKDAMRKDAEDRLEKVNKELDEKNKSITDSIHYAKRIQGSMLPEKKELEDTFPQSFILHKPKDIVSGDFYWIEKFGSKTFIAVADCTGHGVPGALMSIIGYGLLNETISEGIIHPDEILNRLNIGIRKILKQNTKEDKANDGMDIALCAVDNDNGILEFSGANRPLFYFHEGNLTVIKGDKYGVGGIQQETSKKFRNHKIVLETGDSFYACSDGYMDQFGGERGKKLMRKRFLELLQRAHLLPMREQETFLADWFMNWKKDIEQTDDVLVMGIKI